MNTEKTGKLIARIRQQKNMTQQDIADQLHITSKAVSKWERGLSFPSVDILEKLASVLDISVVDILAGEVISEQDAVAQTNALSLQVLRRERKTRNRSILAIGVSFGLLLLLVFCSYHDTLFQRGNPVPYLLAAMRIGDDTPYVEVGSHTGIYISKRGECPELLRFVEESKQVGFVEQLGSGYRFSNGADDLVVIFGSLLEVFHRLGSPPAYAASKMRDARNAASLPRSDAQPDARGFASYRGISKPYSRSVSASSTTCR